MAHRCVQIGCGGRAQFHLGVLNGSSDFELAAVCDLDADLVERTAAEFDVPAAYTDIEEALEAEEPTHVTVVLPPTANPLVVPNVLAAEPDSVVMEKPVANSLGDVERIAEAAGAVGTDVTISHQCIYTREAKQLHDWVAGGRVGEPLRVTATTRGWLLSMGTHVAHLLDWILDRTPAAVRGLAGGPDRMVENPGGFREPNSTTFELCYPGEREVRAFLDIGDEAPTVAEREDTRWLETRVDIVGTEGHAELVLSDHAELVDSSGASERVEAGVDRGRVERYTRDPVHDAEVPAAFAYINGVATEGLYDDQARVIEGSLDSHPAALGSAVSVHRAFDAVMRSATDGRTQSPRPPVEWERSADDRLHRWLSARRPVCMSSMLYLDRDREAVLRDLSRLGVTAVDLWVFSKSSTHFDPVSESPEDVSADLDRYGLDAPVVSVYNEDPVPERLRFSAEFGAETAVMHWRPEQEAQIRDWLDLADELGMTLAFENHVDMALETIADMERVLERLDHPAAGICLAPPHSWVVGDRAEDALARLGDAVEVLYLWDIEPGADRSNADEAYERADNQVPGGGGAVDFERLLAAAVEHAPTAHWALCYHGTEGWDDDRLRQSVARSLRHVERNRPS